MQGEPAAAGGITKVVIRYEDGRVINILPDAGRKAFSEDDLLELKKIVSSASATAEWANVNTRLGF
jgi:hypothetical protein